MAVGSCGINIWGATGKNTPFCDFGSCTVGSQPPAKRSVPNCFLCVSPGRPGLQGKVDDAAKLAAAGTAGSLNRHSLNYDRNVTGKAGRVCVWKQNGLHYLPF